MAELATKLSTPLGDIWVSCVGKDRVLVDANSKGKPGLVMARGGGRYHVVFTLERQGTTWDVAGPLYTSRVWVPGSKQNFKPATPHQIEDIRRKVVPIAIRWAQEQTVALAEAGLAEAELRYRQAQDALAEARTRVQEAEQTERTARQALAEATAALAALTSHDAGVDRR